YEILETCGQKLKFCDQILCLNHYRIYFKTHRYLQPVPLDPFPTFLGVKFDPKLSLKNLLENINAKAMSEINLIRRIKGLKLRNTIELSKIVFKGFIRSQFDYSFIPISCSTQKISSDLQKLQNKILRHIKYFLIKTRITKIHQHLKLDMLASRSDIFYTDFSINELSISNLTAT
ncbi:RNA-directed DNA polymerase from mobile element jockey-like, partial [Brachionus plicatilis]